MRKRDRTAHILADSMPIYIYIYICIYIKHAVDHGEGSCSVAGKMCGTERERERQGERVSERERESARARKREIVPRPEPLRGIPRRMATTAPTICERAVSPQKAPRSESFQMRGSLHSQNKGFVPISCSTTDAPPTSSSSLLLSILELSDAQSL